jgi:hypothetical protein
VSDSYFETDMQRLMPDVPREISDARLDPTGTYRYTLTRHWGTGVRRVLWIMLNPSTADAREDDPTIRRCRIFSRRWGYAGLTVVNLFAFRAPDPCELAAASDPIGPDNTRTLIEELPLHQLVVAAWGARGGLRGRAGYVRKLIAAAGMVVHHLGLTSSGEPKHPLYLSSLIIPQRWDLA